MGMDGKGGQTRVNRSMIDFGWFDEVTEEATIGTQPQHHD